MECGARGWDAWNVDAIDISANPAYEGSWLIDRDYYFLYIGCVVLRIERTSRDFPSTFVQRCELWVMVFYVVSRVTARFCCRSMLFYIENT